MAGAALPKRRLAGPPGLDHFLLRWPRKPGGGKPALRQLPGRLGCRRGGRTACSVPKGAASSAAATKAAKAQVRPGRPLRAAWFPEHEPREGGTRRPHGRTEPRQRRLLRMLNLQPEAAVPAATVRAGDSQRPPRTTLAGCPESYGGPLTVMTASLQTVLEPEDGCAWML